MFDIDGTLVSLDLVERFFCCDLETCLGACCIEGDSGAPLTEEEYRQLKEILPEVWNDLLPQAQEQIKEHGAYRDTSYSRCITQMPYYSGVHQSHQRDRDVRQYTRHRKA